MRARVSAALACSALAFCTAAPPEFDLVIRGGEVMDASGEPARRADVGIKGDRITAVGDLAARGAGEVIEAAGKMVSPGFIDAGAASALALLADGSADSHVRQGVTSEILTEAAAAAFQPERAADHDFFARHDIRPDWTGLSGYFDRLESSGTAVNVGALVPASADDDALDAAMRAGALGVADAVEVADDPGRRKAAARIAARHGGVYGARVPSHASGAPAALDTALRAGQELRVPVILLNPRITGPDASESTRSLFARIREADAAGQRVFATQVPYAAGPSGHVSASTAEEAVRAALRHAFVAIATGTPAVGRGGTLRDVTPHPATYGAMPRVLGRYARELGVMTMREAVRRMTSQAALEYNIPLRGIVREGYYADLVVFDAATIIDRATFDRPNEYPHGIEYVVVNGVITVTPRGHTGARAGRRLARANFEPPTP